MHAPPNPVLSDAQLQTLAAHGETRSAEVGTVLFQVGDSRYPFMAILAGEAAVLDAAGHEIIRHGPASFLGEMNLLSGQTVFLTAVVTQQLRYIAVDREALKPLLFDNGPCPIWFSRPSWGGARRSSNRAALASRSSARSTLSRR